MKPNTPNCSVCSAHWVPLTVFSLLHLWQPGNFVHWYSGKWYWWWYMILGFWSPLPLLFLLLSWRQPSPIPVRLLIRESVQFPLLNNPSITICPIMDSHYLPRPSLSAILACGRNEFTFYIINSIRQIYDPSKQRLLINWFKNIWETYRKYFFPSTLIGSFSPRTVSWETQVTSTLSVWTGEQIMLRK